MKTYETIPAEADQRCDCCGRYHRKLYYMNGFWLGNNCLADYRHYLIDKDAKSLYWHGYEANYRKVMIMTGKLGKIR